MPLHDALPRHARQQPNKPAILAGDHRWTFADLDTLSSLRGCFSGGDAVAPDLQRRFTQALGVPISEVYGLTESIFISVNLTGGPKLGSIGTPVPGIEMRVSRPDGQDAPLGQVGEILVRSPGTMVGYWNDPGGTEDVLPSGWLHTGDLAWKDEDGFYWFAGRAKEIIIRGGSNISPQEVEAVLCQHPAVAEVAVIGIPHADWGQVAAAFVSPRNGETVTEAELQDFAGAMIAAYKVPERIWFLSDLPKGPTGKLLRRALKEMALREALSEA